MSIKKQINLIEKQIQKLESNSLDFDDQIELYQTTMTTMKKLKKSITEKINKIEAVDIE